MTSNDLRFVKASGETFSAEVYIFARVESGKFLNQPRSSSTGQVCSSDMSQTSITVSGNSEVLTPKDRKVKELTERLGKGGIKAFDHIVLFSENPSAVEDNWTVVRVEEVESLPVHLSVKGRLKKMTPLSSHDLRFVKASGQTFTAEVYILARVESGKFLNQCKFRNVS